MLGNFENKIKVYFSNSSKLLLIASLSLLCAVVMLVNSRKTLVVSIDGKQTKIVTFKSTLNVALKSSGIKVGRFDKTSPALTSKVKDGEKVYIKSAVNVSINVDGKVLNIKTADDNIQNVLKDNNVTLDTFDKVEPSAQTAISDGLNINVTRVQYSLLTDTEKVDYQTVVKKDDTMGNDTTKVLQEGQQGENKITTKVVMENGKEVSRKVVSKVATKSPVSKVLAVGTLGVLPYSRGGRVYFTKSMRMSATAYTASYSCTGKGPGDAGYNITRTGTSARRDSSGYSSVAVDPSVIPLGTKLYVEGYGYAVAEDTGGAVTGNTIDLYFNSNSEMNNWGRRSVMVYVLK